MITSISNKEIKELRKLKQRKYREANQQFLIEGLHLIQEAIKHNALIKVITTDETFKSFDNVLLVSDNVFNALSNQKSASGYIGLCNYLTSEIDYSKDIIGLDGIQDPGNCGTILRNALAFDFKNILISQQTVDIYNPKTIQASQGAIFDLNILTCDLNKTVKGLKKQDYFLIGTSLKDAKPLAKDIKQPIKKAIFLGNEGQGMNQELLKLMDINYFIPIANIDSLNVASASAIMFYQFKN